MRGHRYRPFHEVWPEAADQAKQADEFTHPGQEVSNPDPWDFLEHQRQEVKVRAETGPLLESWQLLWQRANRAEDALRSGDPTTIAHDFCRLGESIAQLQKPDEEEYQFELDELHQLHSIEDECGSKSQQEKDREKAAVEARIEGGLDAQRTISELIRKWLTDRNPYSLDLALVYCYQNNMRIPPTLQRFIGELASKRVDGEQPAGTPDKILNQNAKHMTLTFMANLIFHGATLPEAASKAAAHHARKYPGLKHHKASTLHRYYEAFRRDGEESRLFAAWERQDVRMPEGWRNQWQEIRDSTPESSEENKGERR